MKKKLFPALALLLVLAALTAPLGWRTLFTPDETRYAEIAREMIETNDWVTPRLNGVTYFEKPVMGYWIMAGSMKIFGENAFSVRLPSMLAALLCAWCVFLLARKLPGADRKVPWLAGGVFLAFPFVFVLGGIAVLDVIFTAFLTLGLTSFFFGREESGWGWRKAGLLILSGMFFGAAFLTKGFLAFALPGVTIFFYLLIPERLSGFRTWTHWRSVRREMILLPWLPLAGVLIAALPWSILIHEAQPDFWRYFFWEEHIQRFTSNADTQHEQPFWFFLPILPAGIGTCLLYLCSAWKGLREEGLRAPVLRFAACWIGFMLFFLSLSSGKLGTYILPCYPAAALLLAAGIHRRIVVDGIFRSADLGMRILAWILVAAVPVFLIWEFLFPEYSLYGGDWRKDLLMAAAGLCSAGYLAASARTGEAWRKLAFFGASVLPFAIAWTGLVPYFAEEKKEPCPLLERAKANLEKETDAAPVLISFRYPFQAVSWVFKRDDVWMMFDGGELDRGLDFMKARHRVLDLEGVRAKIRENRGSRPVILVMSNNIWFEESENLPEPSSVETNSAKERGYTVLRY